jgi:flagellar motility protein MotE (MotC chaperone)
VVNYVPNWEAILIALGGVAVSVAASYAAWRKGRSDANAMDVETTIKAEEKRAKIKEKSDRQAKDDYRELYLEFHEKLSAMQRDHLECQKELARLGVQYAELKKDSEEKDKRIQTLEKKLGLGSDTFGGPGHAK